MEEVKRGKIKSSQIPKFWIDNSWLWQEELPYEGDCLEEILAE